MTVTGTPDGPDGPDGPGRTGRTRRHRPLLLAAVGYLVASIGLWWGVWSTHPSTTTTCGCGDTSLFTWFIEWPAYALAHGLSPLFSTAMFHPAGVNLLANTSELAIGLPLAPVTWLFGPVATLNVALTLSPVLSALAMFVLLRRWNVWSPVAFVAGFFYGFSPFVVVNLTDAHLMNTMLVVPPLVVACLDELLVRRRRPPVGVGVLLGLLLVVQFFLGTELLVIMAMTGALGLALVVAHAALRDRTGLRRHARHAVVGLGTAAVVAGLALAYPAWFALAGPSHLAGLVWPEFPPAFGGVAPAGYVVPGGSPGSFLDLMHNVGGYQGSVLPDAIYLGVGMLAVLGLGLVVWRRDRRLWLFTTLAAATTVLTFQIAHRPWAPWRLFYRLPVLENVVPSRFVAMTDLSMAIVVALVADHAYRAVRRRSAAGRGHRHGDTAAAWPSWAAPVTALIVAGAAVVPVEATLLSATPLTVVPVSVPAWFTEVAPRLPAGQVVLVYPVAFSVQQSSLTWQAVGRMRYSIAGGGGPQGVASRAGAERPGFEVIAASSSPYVSPPPAGPADVVAVRRALAGWGVTTVVIPDQPGLPAYDRTRHVPYAVALITAATGTRPRFRSGAWVWTGVSAAGPPVAVTAQAFGACVDGGPGTARQPAAVAECILGSGPARPTPAP